MPHQNARSHHFALTDRFHGQEVGESPILRNFLGFLLGSIGEEYGPETAKQAPDGIPFLGAVPPAFIHYSP
jgi:hypothetical protein